MSLKDLIKEVPELKKLLDTPQVAKKAEILHADELPDNDKNRNTKRIILPSGMKEKEAIRHLKSQMDYLETEVAIHHEVECFPLDGANSLMEVMSERYGWVNAVPTEGFFGSSAPTTINIPIGPNEDRDVIWGSFKLPNVEGYLECGSTYNGDSLVFVISGQIKRKNEKEVAELARLVRKHVANCSIYKNRCIKLRVNEIGALDMRLPPRFMDISSYDEDVLIFDPEIEDQLDAQVFTPIRATEHFRAQEVPIKRGVLLEGPYGCGKTLTARATAHECSKNKWTYIYLEDVRGIAEAIKFAARYQPCVLFTEDVDRIVGTQKRTAEVDAVLNEIDGVEGKKREMIVVLTTNHLNQINKAMLRPGRLDGVIHIAPPSSQTAARMVRSYCGNSLSKSENLDEVGEILSGLIPACIRDAVTRAQAWALRDGRTSGELTSKDLVQAAKQVRSQQDRLRSLETQEDPTAQELVGSSINDIVEDVVKKHI